jgi:ABC-2 type transport system permease protein
VIRTLLLRNLRHHAYLLTVLSGGLLLFEVALVWVAARIDMGPEFQGFLQTLLPQDVVESLFSTFGFGSFAGTVSFGYQHPLVLISGIAMVMMVATTPPHERETGFLDLVLSRPLLRSHYITASILEVLLMALLAAVVVLAGTTLGLAVVDVPEPTDWKAYLPAAEGLFLLLSAVGSYTLLLATEAKRRGMAIAPAVGITLLFYWLDFMGEYWDLLETARYLSPFYYFDPARASQTGLAPSTLGVLGGILLVCLPASLLNFNRQDL